MQHSPTGPRGRPKGHPRRGATQVLVLSAMVSMFGFAGLSMDYGRMVNERQRAQNAADAGAFAGIIELPDETKARTAATRLSTANGFGSPTVSIVRDNLGNARGIRVENRLTVPTVFAAVVGTREKQVKAIARCAKTPPANQATGFVPWGVQIQDLVFGQSVTLKLDSSGDLPAPGDFQALAFAGSGADDYRYWIENGYPGTLNVGDWVMTEPGDKVGPTQQATQARITAGSQGIYSSDTVSSYIHGNPRIIIIPFVDWTLSGSGRTDVPVVAFGAFWLESVNGGRVNGQFLRYVDPQHAFYDENVAYAEDGGLYAARLDL